MSSSSDTSAPENVGGIATNLSKKERRKLDKKAAKKAAAASSAAVHIEDDGPLAKNYGDVTVRELCSANDPGAGNWTEAIYDKEWTLIKDLEPSELELVRGRVCKTRSTGSNTFLVLRDGLDSIQCVLLQSESISRKMSKYAASLSKESIIDVIGKVEVARTVIQGTSHESLEIVVQKLYCISRASKLPFNLEDASRSEEEIEKASKEGKSIARVNQDTRLNSRYLDLRTPANLSVFKIRSTIRELFSSNLLQRGFINIDPPILLAGTVQGGAEVFTLNYYEREASLAQSPQLHKQMAINGDFKRVFAIGSAFRAEKSKTNRHLSEFVGLVIEMEIQKHYSEVIDLVDCLFVQIFDAVNERCQKELQTVRQQYPFEPLKYKPKTLRLTFAEGVEMLKDAGVEIDPLGDLRTNDEKKLGQLVLEKYGVDFYILHRYPLATRPFFTMPCPNDGRYSNSFDVFMRGEEIISGAQRIDDKDLLVKRANECNVNIGIESMAKYIESFSHGAPPQGGFGAGLERVVMLFLGLKNVKMTSLFPRDESRLAP